MKNYNDNYNSKQRGYSNRSNRPAGNYNTSQRTDPLKGVQPIKEPLSAYYHRKDDIYLINGPIYKEAEKIKTITNSQLRKVLDLVKESLVMARQDPDNFEAARVRLFALLPMLAYNYGRASNKDKEVHGEVLSFIYTNVSSESIQSIKDIETLDQLVTSLVAYHKFLGGK